MAAPRGNDSRRKALYNSETSGEDEGNESMEHPLLVPQPVEGSRARPSASSPDEQSYSYPDLEAVVVSSKSSLLPENSLLQTGYVRRNFKDVLFPLALLAVLGLTVHVGLLALNAYETFPVVVEVILTCAVLLSMLVVILSAPLVIGLGYIWLFHTYTEMMATRVIPGFLVTCGLLSLGVATLLSWELGNSAGSWMLLLFAFGWCVLLLLLLLRSRLCDIDMCLKTLKIVSQSISDNLQLLNVWILYMLSAFVAMQALLWVFLGVTIYHHLSFVLNPDAVPGVPCTANFLGAVPCYIIDLKDWTRFWVLLLGGFCIWFLVGLKLHCRHKNAVRRRVARWYFAHISRSTSRRSTTSDSSLKSSVIFVKRSLASGLRFLRYACQSAVAIFTRPLSSAKLTFNWLKRTFCSTVAGDVSADYFLKLYTFLCIVMTTVLVFGFILSINFTESELPIDDTTAPAPDFDKDQLKFLAIFVYTWIILVLALLASFFVLGWWLSTQRAALAAILECKRQEDEELLSRMTRRMDDRLSSDPNRIHT